MSRSLAHTTAAYALVVACWTALRALRGRQRVPTQGAALAVLQAALALQALLAGVAWIGGEQPAEPETFAGYLAASLVVLPGGWLLARDDANPWGSAPLVVAAFGIAPVALRMGATWGLDAA